MQLQEQGDSQSRCLSPAVRKQASLNETQSRREVQVCRFSLWFIFITFLSVLNPVSSPSRLPPLPGDSLRFPECRLKIST